MFSVGATTPMEKLLLLKVHLLRYKLEYESVVALKRLGWFSVGEVIQIEN
jgi:hypothetical protein